MNKFYDKVRLEPSWWFLETWLLELSALLGRRGHTVALPAFPWDPIGIPNGKDEDAIGDLAEDIRSSGYQDARTSKDPRKFFFFLISSLNLLLVDTEEETPGIVGDPRETHLCSPDRKNPTKSG
ncbi:hypothetical protein HZH68_008084 [Vespula germanica]|uniref:Uncharacterized protein n=2 Tax=Vespula TaxID=7451 RepID=A0A834K4W9_VESGE|nr:hypothetical protein HZH68_008084 [Vespula germanica]KAF7423502.1 hypothetical protein H0235_008785 [Vespula pensylvanica]